MAEKTGGESPNLGFRHRFLPPRDPGEPRTLILFHGTGGDEADLLPLGSRLLEGAALLGIRGKVVEGGANRFFRRLAEGVFDEDDIVFRSAELAEFLEDATRTYGLDPRGRIAVGLSNGANMAAALLLLHPEIFAQAILFRSMLPLRPPDIPDLEGVRVLMSAGRRDPLIPAASVAQLADTLREGGADVRLAWQEAGHGLVPSDLSDARAWLAQEAPGA